MAAPEHFETARLFAERLRPTHFEDMCALHRDERVMATLGGLRTDQETQAMMDTWVARWEQHGCGAWMVYASDARAFIGRALLQPTHVAGRDEVEVGWAVCADAWGRGYATEFGAELVRIGFECLARQDLVSFTLPTNPASQRVMEKLGFQYECDTEYKGLPHVLFRQTAAQWSEARVAR